MIVRLIKFISGYIIFCGVGGFNDRFINLCAVKRIFLWDVSLADNTIKAKVKIKDYKKLRAVARKTGVKVRIHQKCGLPFYLRNHRDRIGLIIGAGIFLFFITVMNNFVWCIQTESSDKFSRKQIIEAAENAGLKYGVSVKGFDEEKAAREIYKAFEGEISWVKVNIKGSLAVIDFRDKVKKIETQEKGEPSNIVADFDGVILSNETYQGSQNKSKGDAVRKGEVLISGVVEGVDSKPLYYQAKGKFTALHKVNLQRISDKTTLFYSFKDCSQKRIISVFGLDIPYCFSLDSTENKRKFIYENFLEFDGYEIPFGIKKMMAVNYDKSDITDREKELLFILEYTDEEYFKFKNSNILTRQITLTKKNDVLNVAAEYICIDYIGESKKIFIENNENS